MPCSNRMRGAGTALLLALTLSACGTVGGGTRYRPVADTPVRVGKPYTIKGITYAPADTADYDALGYASWYGSESGNMTANGERFEPGGVTAAHKTLPLPCYVEVTALDTEGMLREGREYAKIAPNIVIKCPLTLDGLKATRTFRDEGTKVNVTLCFSVNQALLAAKAGATYVSPFVGRLDDQGADGMQLIHDIRQIYDNYDFDTEILAASLRNTAHIAQAALAGADCATLPAQAFKDMFKHPLTDKGLETFLADWAKTGQSIL